MRNTKHHLMASFILMAILFLSSEKGIAQDYSIKLGKYSQEELEMTECAFEPEATAIVLGEQGISFFTHGKLITEVKKRIKVFDSKATDYADISLTYYAGDNNKTQNITGLKAQVMNLVNGKEEITKLSKKDYFETDLGNGVKEIRFTFPNVKEGSIIEYEYDHYYDNITFLDGWQFQNEIPTLFSKYAIDIPEYLDYRFLGQGENFVVANQNRVQNNGKAEWTLTKLKSTRPEPYMNNYVDYLDKIEFQLAGYKDGNNNGIYKSVLSDWQKLADEIYSIDIFRSYFRNNGTFKDLAEKEIEGDTDREKAEFIYQMIKKDYTLNDELSFIPDQSIKKLVEEKVGSKTELNLLLIAMLRANGIEATPLLISSKGNGRSYLVQFPFVRQFNKLIVKANIESQEFFLDASNEYVPFGYLPLGYHVDGGFLIQEEGSHLTTINLEHKSGISQMVDISLENDSIKFGHTVRYIDYDAIRFMEQYNDIDEEKLAGMLEEEDIRVLDLEVNDLERKNNQIESTFSVNMPFEKTAELLLINPIMISRHDENPFKIDERVFPVDFNYVYRDSYIANIHIPEGYELDDYPEPISMSMPGGLAKFMYMPQEDTNNNMLRINIRYDLKSKLVQASNYAELKAFMEYMVNKIQEPVVLKKISS
ncbi:DUF3857 and transglutaminase domain-containing protein [Echinicola salinicaeni]|uniref:DUF3857 and transglutaminase domain-containing protein n=1 Tax=Echinicola salinicaeni TaxID=2762757 RepID=UPI0016462BA9|nr:DUF3857 and transglutaminase domain-containing protein [Echinicola salinicaeni]